MSKFGVSASVETPPAAMELTIAHFYPELLNLYGDRGNVFCLLKRCRWRGIKTKLIKISPRRRRVELSRCSVDFLFMGGGPDRSQVEVAEDLKKTGAWIKNYIERGGVGLFVCGAYQLMGLYYQNAAGGRLAGLGIFDLYTKHFGQKRPRCIGNVVVEVDSADALSNRRTLVGFENHGGRTYLGKKVRPLGRVVRGRGNNGEDDTEGARYRNAFGTYLHGPLLPKNPHLADYLIELSLRRKYGKKAILPPLDDALEWRAHRAALRLR